MRHAATQVDSKTAELERLHAQLQRLQETLDTRTQERDALRLDLHIARVCFPLMGLFALLCHVLALCASEWRGQKDRVSAVCRMQFLQLLQLAPA